MDKRKMLVGVLLVMVMLLATGCMSKKYEIIGTWEGNIQQIPTKIVLTSESSGTLTYLGYNFEADLTCIKIDKKTFEMSYGGYFSDINGNVFWIQEKIVAEFQDEDTWIARVYNVNNQEIAVTSFHRK